MKPTKYTYEIYNKENNELLGVVSVDGYEDNALWLAHLKLSTITNLGSNQVIFKQI